MCRLKERVFVPCLVLQVGIAKTMQNFEKGEDESVNIGKRR